MKTQTGARILIAGFFCALCFGCAMYPHARVEAISGTWTNAFGTIWELRNDGTFDVDLNHDGRRDAWGTFTVENDVITIHGTGGMVPKGCDGDGVYRFTRGHDTLRFSRVHDGCKLRVKNVLLAWHRRKRAQR